MTADTPSPRPSPLPWLLLALSAAIAVAWFVYALGYWEDDAYIHLEFARSLAAGRGFQFNGHLVYGDTSPLWVGLLVAFHAVIPNWLAAGKALTAVAAVFALTGVYALARSLVRAAGSDEQASLFAATMLLAFVLNPYFGYWAFSGMEALAAAGLACWTLVLAAAPRLGPSRLLLAACAAGLAPLLRPELALFAFLAGLLLLYRLSPIDFSSRPEAAQTGAPVGRSLPERGGWAAGVERAASRPNPKIPTLLAAILLLLTPTLDWSIYAIHTFGSLLPTTNAAKRAAPHDSVLNRLAHIYAFGYPTLLLGLLLLAAWLVYRATRSGDSAGSARLDSETWFRRITAVPLTITLLFFWSALTTVFYVADHTLVQTRYIFITAPLLTIALAALGALHWPGVYRWLVTATLLFGAAVSLLSTRPLVRNKVRLDAIYAELAQVLRTLPPDAPVAHYSIGEAAFLSQHPIVDLGGITRPSVIPYLWDASDDRRTAWIYTQGAQYEVIDHQPVPGATLLWSRDIPPTSWHLDPRAYTVTERLQLWKLPQPR
jgi:hypothetical protein